MDRTRRAAGRIRRSIRCVVVASLPGAESRDRTVDFAWRDDNAQSSAQAGAPASPLAAPRLACRRRGQSWAKRTARPGELRARSTKIADSFLAILDLCR